ncbi:beta strand repeat-containing protein [Jiulongibacter sp. NS-SX5]|uniref:beta strand repeat-containing protein n=1 Tax=Jiulongibacter sp. NS-SX5 TaxID=3463854 RepID=UPI004059DDD4
MKKIAPIFLGSFLLSISLAFSQIGASKTAQQIGREQIFTIYLENYYENDTLFNVSVPDDLDAVFGAGNYSVSSPSATGSLVVNSSYDGSANTELLQNTSFLKPGELATITFGITITQPSDQGLGFGIYSNQVTASGTHNVDGVQNDLSDSGTNPDPNNNDDPTDAGEDDPTLIDILQNPKIGVAKTVRIEGNEVHMRFYLENLGNRNLENISLIDDLNDVFGAGNYAISAAPNFFDPPSSMTLNSSYNGGTIDNLISSGSLFMGETAGIEISVNVTNVTDQGLGLGIYENQAEVIGFSNTGKQTSDLSDEGTDPDPNGNNSAGDPDEGDETRIVIGEEPTLGLAKVALIQGDEVTFEIYLENLGNVTLDNLEITDDLESVFGTGNYNVKSLQFLDLNSNLTLNSSYNGKTQTNLIQGGTLAAGEIDTIQLMVENIILSDQGNGLGNYQNQVWGSAYSPGDVYTFDQSDSGINTDANGNGNANEPTENDKTSFTISPLARIGLALDYRIVSFAGSSPTIEYIYTLTNYGNQRVSNLSISQDLNTVYGGGNYIHTVDPSLVSGSSTLNYNSAFNGSTNTALLNGGSYLDPNESVRFSIRHLVTNITDQGFGSGIYQAQVTAIGTDPNSTPVSDASYEGNNPDPNNDGNPSENDPTTIDVNGNPSIGLALDASVSGNMITLDYYMENLGDVGYSELSIVSNLDQVFGAGNYTISTPPTFVDDPGTISINSTFDGTSENQDLFDLQNSTLSSGDTGQLRLIITLNNVKNTQNLGIGNYSLQATISGLNQQGAYNSDLSDFGTDPDPNGNGNANEGGENDATTLSINLDKVGIAQTASVSGFQVTLDIYFENHSLNGISNLDIINDLDESFGSGNYSIISSPTLIVDPGTITLNGSFDGSNEKSIISNSSTLAAGATAQIQLTLNIDTESDQGSGYGVYSNQSLISGITNSGFVITDNSDDGTDPDPNGNDDPSDAGEEDATPIVITGNPSIGIAKRAVVNGTEVTLIFTIENLGDVTLSNILLQDPLNPVFGSSNYSVTSQPQLVSGPGTIIRSTQFFGFNIFDRITFGGTLRPGETEIISTTINITTVSDQGNGFGIYQNGVTISATDPGGNQVNDTSDEGYTTDSDSNGDAGDAGEDDVTTITIGDEANLGVALDATVNGTQVTLDYYLENFGNSALSTLSLIHDLNEVFGAGNFSILSGPTFIDDPGTVVLNSSYNGNLNTELISSGNLAAYDTGQIRIVVEVINVINQGKGKGYYITQVLGSGNAPLGTYTQDYSDFNTDPDSDGNSLPFNSTESDSTFFLVDFSSIGLSQTASLDCDSIVTITKYIQNLGTSTLDSISVQLDLDNIFGAGTYTIQEAPTIQSAERGLVLNQNYNGSSEIDILLPGSVSSGGGIEVVSIKVKLNAPVTTTYSFNSTISATDTDNNVFTDISDSGTNPDFNGNKIPSDSGENDATELQSYSPLVLGITSVNLICNQDGSGSIDLSVSGGNIGSGYTYSWSNSASTKDLSSLAAGTYSVTVTDANSCTATASVTITEPTALIASINSSSNLTCNQSGDGAIDLEVTGGTVGSGYTYSWSNSATTQDLSSLAAGTYSVTVTDANSCTATASVTITEPTALVASINGSTNLTCNQSGDGAVDLQVTGGTVGSGYTYSWSNSATSQDLSSLAAGTYSVTVTDANSCTATASVTITEPTALVASISGSTNLTCNQSGDGAITLQVSGGTVGSGYTYSWSNSASTKDLSSLAAGTYSVTVTDANSCTATASVTITEPTALIASINSSSNLTCNQSGDGAIDLEVTGGTVGSGYTYSWSNSASTQDLSSLAAGTYSVTVTDANSCTATASVTITEPTALVASINGSTNLTCNQSGDGAVDLQVTGGTVGSGYTYSWSNSATSQDLSSLAAGTYSVTVTDANSCTATASVTITEPTALVASISGSTNLTCNQSGDGAITLQVSGGTVGSGYTYSWSNSASTKDLSLLAAGTYSVTVTDANSCTATASVTITEPTLLVASINSSTNLSCNQSGDGAIDLQVTGGTVGSGYTYSWSNSATTQDLNSLAAGTYSVTVTDANSCTATASETITEPTALVASINGSTNLTCNQSGDGSIDLQVTGGTVGSGYTYSWSNSATTQDLSSLAAGTYSVTVTDANSCTATASVTITEPTALVASISGSTNLSCNQSGDGAITLQVTGGTVGSGYTYSWSNSTTTQDLSSLAAGTYSVTVTDANSCTATASVTITEPTALVASINSSTNLTCNQSGDGAIDLQVTGGTVGSGYTYSWSNSATTQDLSSLAAGTYSVTVTDANSCTTTASVTITEPALLTATVSSTTNLICYGVNTGSIELTVNGGTSDFQYLWSNGSHTKDISSLAAGTYSVTVTDANSCTATASTSLTQPAQQTITLTKANNPTSCSGSDGSLEFNTQNIPDGNYTASYYYNSVLINTTIEVRSNIFVLNNLTTGLYNNLTVSVTPCTVNWNNPTSLTAPSFTTSASNTGPYEVGDQIQLMVASGVSFEWSGPNSFYSNLQSPTIPNAVEASAGTYEVIVQGANQCVDTVQTVVTVNCQPAKIKYYLVYGGPTPEIITELTDDVTIQKDPSRLLNVFAVPECNSNIIESMKLQLSGTSELQFRRDNEPIYALYEGNGVYNGDHLSPNLYTFIATAYGQDDNEGEALYPSDVIQFWVTSGTRTVSTPSVPNSYFCNGQQFNISVTSSGEFEEGNLYQVQLSDKNGEFSKNTMIGFSNNPAAIPCTIPSDMESGSNYKLKVISTHPVVSSAVTSAVFEIIGANRSLVSTDDDINAGSQLIRAVRKIDAQNKIDNPGRLDIEAGKSVELHPGFKADNGSIFSAKIKEQCANEG